MLIIIKLFATLILKLLVRSLEHPSENGTHGSWVVSKDQLYIQYNKIYGPIYDVINGILRSQINLE